MADIWKTLRQVKCQVTGWDKSSAHIYEAKCQYINSTHKSIRKITNDSRGKNEQKHKQAVQRKGVINSRKETRQTMKRCST